MRCSCGCRRKVRRRDRSANVRARAARRLVVKMEALSFDADPDEYRRAFLFEGVSWRNQYTGIVHGEMSRELLRAESAWSLWHSGARPAVKAALREPNRVPGYAPPAPPASIASPDQPLFGDVRAVVATTPSAHLMQRVRELVDGRDGVSEGTVFGCSAWMVNGNVACAAMGDDLVVRVDPCDCDRILAEEDVHAATKGSRALRGFIVVDATVLADGATLARWIDAGTGYAAWLSPKATESSTRSRPASAAPDAHTAAPIAAASRRQRQPTP